MTTQKIISDIRSALDKRRPIPPADVRALVAICESLVAVATRQQEEITALKKAAMPESGAGPEPQLRRDS
jgi:hypothetical protein